MTAFPEFATPADVASTRQERLATEAANQGCLVAIGSAVAPMLRIVDVALRHVALRSSRSP